MQYEKPMIARTQLVARMILQCSPSDKIDDACVVT